MKCGFSIKRPGNGRKTFAIHKKLHSGRGGQPQVQDSGLESINRNLVNGLLTHDEAYFQIKTVVIPRLKKQAKVKALGDARLSQHNRKVFRKFWESEYEGKKILRPEVARNDFLCALEGIDPVSIASASRDDLQKKLDKAFPTNNRHNRYGSKINRLLRFLGRDFSLHLSKKDTPVVHYVTWDELQKIVAHITEPEIKDLATVLFCTGLRLGEAFVLTERDLKPNGTIYVHKQMTPKGKIRAVKNRKPHHTIILKEGIEAFKRWGAIEDKARFRHTGQNKIIKAAREAFHGDPSRQISPHDLRHSYVIHMLGLGVPLDKVARLIGDTLKTTEEHYAGFVMSDSEIDYVLKIVKK